MGRRPDPHLHDRNVQFLHSRYVDRLSLKDVAAKHGVCIETVRRSTAPLVETIVERWDANENAVNEIAELLQVSSQIVNAVLVEHRDSIDPPGARPSRVMSDYHRRLGSGIAALRTSLDISYDDFARSIPMASKRLARIEKGLHDIELSQMVKLAAAFGISMEELIWLSLPGRETQVGSNRFAGLTTKVRAHHATKIGD